MTETADNLPQRLRGEITMLTIDPEGDVWRLRKEAAREIERLRVALNHIAENVCRQPKEATKLFALRELS